MLGAERVRTADDARTNRQVRVPSDSLVGGCEPVAGSSSVLKINRGDQSIRVNRAVEYNFRPGRPPYVSQVCRVGRYERRPSSPGEGSKVAVAAQRRAVGIAGHYPKMISGVRRQTADIRNDILHRAPSHSLVGGCEPVAGSFSILKTNRGG
jgi:hypothetical protein